MAITKTSLKPGDNLPPRGKSNKTRILNAIRERSLLGMNKSSTREEAETAFFGEIAETAFNKDDPSRGVCLKLLGDKGWSSVKPVNALVEFELDESQPPHILAAQIMKAIASSGIAPDIGVMLMNSISTMMNIKEVADFEERLKAIENAKEQN